MPLALAFRVAIAVFAASAVIACHPSAGTVPLERSTTVSPRTRTTVTVDWDAASGTNPQCESLCERLSACSFALGGEVAMLPSSDARAECRVERRGCRQSTVERDCCAALPNCSDFARCYAASHDVPSECSGRASAP